MKRVLAGGAAAGVAHTAATVTDHVLGWLAAGVVLGAILKPLAPVIG